MGCFYTHHWRAECQAFATLDTCSLGCMLLKCQWPLTMCCLHSQGPLKHNHMVDMCLTLWKTSLHTALAVAIAVDVSHMSLVQICHGSPLQVTTAYKATCQAPTCPHTATFWQVWWVDGHLTRTEAQTLSSVCCALRSRENRTQIWNCVCNTQTCDARFCDHDCFCVSYSVILCYLQLPALSHS